MSPAGRPKIDNPKSERLEIRITNGQYQKLQDIASDIGTNKTDILMRGLQLVELQMKNKDFADLANCLILRELLNKESLTPEDKSSILGYIELLKKNYI